MLLRGHISAIVVLVLAWTTACGPKGSVAGDAATPDIEDDDRDVDERDIDPEATDPETDAIDAPPAAVCGNGALEDGEECDDGNEVEWDGCMDCRIVAFKVNARLFMFGMSTSVAMAPDGRFVVAWDSYDGDGDWYAVMVREFSDTGEAGEGTEWPINWYSYMWQHLPSVAMSRDADYAVAWQSSYQDGDGEGVFGQVVEWGLRPDDWEFQVNTLAEGEQESPDLAMAPDGRFVVVWRSYGRYGEIGDDYRAQLFDATGSPTGPELMITERYDAGSVAMFGDGGFVVVGSGGNFETGYDIFAQRFNADGSPLEYEFVVNTIVERDQLNAVVAAAADGRHVVAWRSLGRLRAQIFAADGTEAGPEIGLSDESGDHDAWAFDVAMAPDGGFVVAWRREYRGGEYPRVYGRLFDASGSPLTDEFPVCGFTGDLQTSPSVAMDGYGRFVITWEIHTDYEDYEDHGGIFAQRYDASGRPRGLLPW